MRLTLFAAAAAFLPALPLAAQDMARDMAAADVINRDGASIGTVTLTAQPSGTTLVELELDPVPSGTHAVHLHETGDCSADDFTSAGGHIAGDMQHGISVNDGPHPGDLPNVTVGDDGTLMADFFNPHLSIEEMILDEDGAAFIMHAGADDYTSQPAGAAGERIACGVFSGL